MNKQNKKVEDKFSTAIINSLPGLFYLIDENRKFHRWNKNMEIVSGYSAEEISKINCDIFFSDDERPLIAAAMHDVFTKGLGNVEVDFITKDGREIPMHFSGVRYIEKDVPYMLGIGIDITERKQTEGALLESEEKYKALYNDAPLSYQSLDENGCFLDINPSWLKTLGYSREEVIGKNYGDFLHPDWKPHFEKNFPAFKKRGYISDVQFKIRHKEGHFIDISFEGCIGYHPDGSFKQTYCVFHDITESKKAEEKLALSEKRYRSLFNTMTEMFQVLELIYDKHGKVIDYYYLDVNPAFERLVAKPRDQIIGKRVKELFGTIEDYWIQAYQQVNKTGTASYFEGYGAELSKFYSANIWKISEAKVAVIFSDITEQKKIRDTLAESQILNQTLLDTSPDIIYVYDIIERKNVYSNQGIMKILGYSIEEVQTMGEKLLPDLMHPDDFKSYLQNIIPRYQTAKDGESINNEYRMKHKNGNWIWLQSRESIFKRQDDGSPKQIFGLNSDITNRKKYDKEIKQLNSDLEKKIKERTQDLEKKNKTLEKMNKVFVGRELRMKELKNKIESLKGTSTGSV